MVGIVDMDIVGMEVMVAMGSMLVREEDMRTRDGLMNEKSACRECELVRY